MTYVSAKLAILCLQFFGIEIPHDFGGAESSFFNANIVIEELAKVMNLIHIFCKT